MTKKGSIYGEEDNLVISRGKGGEGYVSTLRFFFPLRGEILSDINGGGEEGGVIFFTWPTVKKQCLHSVT